MVDLPSILKSVASEQSTFVADNQAIEHARRKGTIREYIATVSRATNERPEDQDVEDLDAAEGSV